MSTDAELFRIIPEQVGEIPSLSHSISFEEHKQAIHLTALESRDARMEKIKASSELLGVEERMAQLIMEQLYWQNRLSTAEASLADEAALVAEEKLRAKIERTALLTTIVQLLGMLATGKLITEAPEDDHVERVLKLVEAPLQYPSDEDPSTVLAS